MEIDLDIEFIQRTLADERTRTRADLAARGVSAALAGSQSRHDARIAAAPDVSTLDCCAGCTWCCHFTVDVRAAEVFAIQDFVEQTFAPDEKARVYAEVKANGALLRDLNEHERMTRNLRCPFLAEGRCSIYAVRPQTCRNYHATNVGGCQLSYENPGDLDIDPEFAPGVYQAGAAHVEGFSTALQQAGYDVQVYELNSAIQESLADPSARERYAARQAPFRGLAGESVPAEFDDLNEA